MLKSKISGTIQEVVLPDFPDDDNTVTTTVTKSRRVSFGTNFVKEFIVGSAVSAQCMSEYEQAFPSSDSSNADSSHSAAEIGILDQSKFAMPESYKVHKAASTVGQTVESESVEIRPKPSKFSRTICFSADSPTADMEFTEGCITLAKSILDKKNKEMTVIIQAVPKEPKELKEQEKSKEEETKYFDASQFEMSLTKCLKSKENKREEKKFDNEKTKIFSKFEDEMSITRCNKIFSDGESDSSWVNCKENLLPLDMIMHHLDKDNSDLENDLFNPKNSFSNFLSANPFDISNDSEKLNLNESMDISTDFHPHICKESQKTTLPDDKLSENKTTGSDLLGKIILNESMEISDNIQPILSKAETSPLFFEQPNKDESEKICADLLSDIHETSQNSIKSDEANDFARTDKFDSPEKVFPNVPIEVTADTSHVVEDMEILLQPKNNIIEDKLKNLNRSDEASSAESMEICEDIMAEEKSVHLPEAVNLSSFGEEIYNNQSKDLNNFEKESVNESINMSTGCQSDIPKGSENLLLQDNPNDDVDLMENKKLMENKQFFNDAQPNVVEACEVPTSPEKICNENTGLKEVQNTSHSVTQPDVSEVFESLPPKEPMTSDKPTKLRISEKLNSSAKCDTDCQPPNDDEEIVPEVEHNSLNENEPMEISVSENEASGVAERPLLNEKVAKEVPLSNLEKLNSEGALEVSADNQSRVIETVENPQPTETVATDNSDEPRMDESVNMSADTEPNVLEVRQNSSPDVLMKKSVEFNSSNDTEEVPTWNKEPFLVDIKTIENLKEQSKEPGCIWSLKDLCYPQGKTSGLLSFNCELLESATTISFYLKTSNDDGLDSCSIIKSSEISLNEEKQCRLPEYGLVIEFGFQELKKFFDERRQKLETIRHIPYFLDQINSFMHKMNSYLGQIHSILTLYPGSRLKDSVMTFRLYSFPLFFSCVVSVDLTDLFRLSKSSLSFENDFGTLDENKIREIFEKCLKNKNLLCEFVVQSTNYLFDLEKKSGYVSKRGHIRLLPVELKL